MSRKIMMIALLLLGSGLLTMVLLSDSRAVLTSQYPEGASRNSVRRVDLSDGGALDHRVPAGHEQGVARTLRVCVLNDGGLPERNVIVRCRAVDVYGSGNGLNSSDDIIRNTDDAGVITFDVSRLLGDTFVLSASKGILYAQSVGQVGHPACFLFLREGVTFVTRVVDSRGEPASHVEVRAYYSVLTTAGAVRNDMTVVGMSDAEGMIRAANVRSWTDSIIESGGRRTFSLRASVPVRHSDVIVDCDRIPAESVIELPETGMVSVHVVLDSLALPLRALGRLPVALQDKQDATAIAVGRMDERGRCDFGRVGLGKTWSVWLPGVGFLHMGKTAEFAGPLRPGETVETPVEIVPAPWVAGRIDGPVTAGATLSIEAIGADWMAEVVTDENGVFFVALPPRLLNSMLRGVAISCSAGRSTRASGKWIGAVRLVDGLVQLGTITMTVVASADHRAARAATTAGYVHSVIQRIALKSYGLQSCLGSYLIQAQNLDGEEDDKVVTRLPPTQTYRVDGRTIVNIWAGVRPCDARVVTECVGLGVVGSSLLTTGDWVKGPELWLSDLLVDAHPIQLTLPNPLVPCEDSCAVVEIKNGESWDAARVIGNVAVVACKDPFHARVRVQGFRDRLLESGCYSSDVAMQAGIPVMIECSGTTAGDIQLLLTPLETWGTYWHVPAVKTAESWKSLVPCSGKYHISAGGVDADGEIVTLLASPEHVIVGESDCNAKVVLSVK